MSESRQILLDRVKTILTALQEEKIDSSNDSALYTRKIVMARELANQEVMSKRLYIGAHEQTGNITASAAVTWLKLGLCQELIYRFILEYCLKYQDQKISLIVLGNPDGDVNSTHSIVFLGQIDVPDSLLKAEKTKLPPKKSCVSLQNFLDKNKDGILVDPLLNCSGMTKEELAPLHQYCKKHSFSHVIRVDSFHNIGAFLKSLAKIKFNAMSVAYSISSTTSILFNKDLKEPTKKSSSTSKVKKSIGNSAVTSFKPRQDPAPKPVKQTSGTNPIQSSSQLDTNNDRRPSPAP